MVNDKPSYLIVNKVVMAIIAAKSVSLKTFKFGWFYRNATIQSALQASTERQIHLK